MNQIVDRESLGLRAFATDAENISGELEKLCLHLEQELSDASSYMQEHNGQEAIAVVYDLVDETLSVVNYLNLLVGRITKSADLLESSDSLL